MISSKSENVCASNESIAKRMNRWPLRTGIPILTRGELAINLRKVYRPKRPKGEVVTDTSRGGSHSVSESRLAVGEKLRRVLRDLDLPGLGLLTLVERDVEDPVLEVGLYRALVHSRRKCEAAQETGIPALVEQVVAGFLVFRRRLLLLRLTLRSDRKSRVFQ